MIRATTILPAGSWTGAVADTVLLDYDARHRRRLAMSGRGGVSFLLDLPMAVGLRHGDGLLLEDGRIIAVEAAREPLVEVSAESQPQLNRIAWHIGNRQLPTQMAGSHLRIRPDPTVEAVLAGLGATMRRIEAPFDPEPAPQDEESPWSGFWQSFDGQAFAQGFGSSRGPGHAESHSSFHRSGPNFAEAHGHSFSHGHASSHGQSSSHGQASGGPGRQTHSWSESHTQSPGHEQHGRSHHEHGKASDPDDPPPRQS